MDLAIDLPLACNFSRADILDILLLIEIESDVSFFTVPWPGTWTSALGLDDDTGG
jgi:hypothetical protein